MTKITIERETLLPCPFCGCGAAITGTEWDGREQYFVACTGPDCHCAVGENYDRDACPEYSFSSKAEAIAAWNRRAALAVQPADNADFESWLSTNPIPAGASMKQAMCIAYAAASKRIAAQPAEPVAWINRRVIYDPATDSVTGYGEPELSFERASYGYDYANAKPLVLAQPAPAAVPPGYALVPIEPTHGMLSALTQEWHPSKHGPMKQRYRAMIAAAGDKQ